MNPDSITIESISARLRSIRNSRGWSLRDVESISHGQVKAVVLGSYERGSRTLSVRRALQLAEIYNVPFSSLFSEKNAAPVLTKERVVLDLRSITRKFEDTHNQNSSRYAALVRFTQSIVRSRQDWNGEVLSMRDEDLALIALLLNLEAPQLLQWLDSERILLATRR